MIRQAKTLELSSSASSSVAPQASSPADPLGSVPSYAAAVAVKESLSVALLKSLFLSDSNLAACHDESTKAADERAARPPAIGKVNHDGAGAGAGDCARAFLIRIVVRPAAANIEPRPGRNLRLAARLGNIVCSRCGTRPSSCFALLG